MPTRRQTLTAVGSTALAATGLATLTSEESRAMGVTMGKLTIPNHSKSLNGTVGRVQLSVTGEYSYSLNTAPSRLVLRLEVKPADQSEWTQLNARAVRDLSKKQSTGFTLGGNVLQHPSLNGSDFTPASRGESTSVELDVRLKMTLSDGGNQLGSESVEDSVVVSVSKKERTVEMSVGGTGSVVVETATTEG